MLNEAVGERSYPPPASGGSTGAGGHAGSLTSVVTRPISATTSATTLLLKKVCDTIEDVSLVFTFASHFTASL